MVFQKPNPFPKSIYENMAYGLIINGVKDKGFIEERVISSLKKAVLFDDVKDRLHDSALMLSGGPAAEALHRPLPGGGARGHPL